MKIVLTAVAICLIASTSFVGHTAQADVVIAPDRPHAFFNSIPFSLSSGDTRYQQVFSPANFSTRPMSIEAISFSPRDTGTFAANVSIRLGTTTVPVGGLDVNLDNNVTSGLTTVFSDASFSQMVTGGTETFSLTFDFSTTPFVFDPILGQNLLLDVVVSSSNYGGGMSRTDGTGLSSRAYNSQGFGNGTSDGALRTQFQFTQVIPEPAGSTVIMAIIMTSCLVTRVRRD